MPNATVNGITIDYATAGDGPPVLLICGTGQPADLWFAQVADLTAAGHTVITFDNRGCGRSEAPPAPYRVADMAADTAALIEYLGLGPCDIIGYSLGGYIAQELAVTRADLVRRLVLLAGAGPAPAYAVARAHAAVDLASALDPPPPSFDVADLLLSLHSMAQLQDDDDAVKITISLIEAGAPWTNPGRLGQYQADLAWLEDSSSLDRLSRIESPCLAMAFEHDCWFPPRAVRQAAERIPGCQYTELPGLGHGAPLLAAGQVNPILAEFLGTGQGVGHTGSAHG
jgi:pimeloyl-ACP methyl ester carboxylesterase